MGGDVTVTNSVSGGSIFRFEIPIEADESVAGRAHLPPDYLYADEGAVPQLDAVMALPLVVSPEQLAKLPSDLINQLHDAVQEGEKDRLDQLIQRVEQYDKQAAGRLKELAENYEYDALTHLLAETKRRLRQ
jgi:hypothetical protein